MVSGVPYIVEICMRLDATFQSTADMRLCLARTLSAGMADDQRSGDIQESGINASMLNLAVRGGPDWVSYGASMPWIPVSLSLGAVRILRDAGLENGALRHT